MRTTSTMRRPWAQGLVCVSFCVPSQPCIMLMPRRGWSAMDVPSGWVQVLRGSSVRWSMAANRGAGCRDESGGRSGSLASTQREVQECGACTSSSRSRRGVGGRTFESLQFGGSVGGHGESSGSRGGRSPQCVVEGEAGFARTAILAHTDACIERSRLRIQKLDQEREVEMELQNSALQRQARLRDGCRAKCRYTPSPIRFRGRVGEVEGQSCPAPVIQSEDLRKLPKL